MKISYPAVSFLLAISGAHGSTSTNHLRSRTNGDEIGSAATTSRALKSDDTVIMDLDEYVEKRAKELKKIPLGSKFQGIDYDTLDHDLINVQADDPFEMVGDPRLMDSIDFPNHSTQVEQEFVVGGNKIETETYTSSNTQGFKAGFELKTEIGVKGLWSKSAKFNFEWSSSWTETKTLTQQQEYSWSFPLKAPPCTRITGSVYQYTLGAEIPWTAEVDLSSNNDDSLICFFTSGQGNSGRMCVSFSDLFLTEDGWKTSKSNSFFTTASTITATAPATGYHVPTYEELLPCHPDYVNTGKLASAAKEVQYVIDEAGTKVIGTEPSSF